jgi:LacI family transcriptional regulator
VFVVPQGENSFMQELRAEIGEAIRRSGMERTHIRIVDVPAFDGAALADQLNALRVDPPAGVAVVAVDAPAVHDAIDALRAAGSAVLTLVSDLPNSSRDHFTGVDNLAAGRTAGSLMGRFLSDRAGNIAVIAGSMLVGDHRDRLTGFGERLAAINPRLEILPVMEGHDDPDAVYRLVTHAFAAHVNIAGIYSLGAGNRGLIRALKVLKGASSHPAVIAHELTPHTREALKDGLIDAVLNQDAGHEVRSAIRVLKARADGQAMISAQERIRIDIFLKDNLP